MELNSKVFRTHRLRRIESKVQTTAAAELSLRCNNREKLCAGNALSEFNVFCAYFSAEHAVK